MTRYAQAGLRSLAIAALIPVGAGECVGTTYLTIS